MDKQPSREILEQRIAALEEALRQQQAVDAATIGAESFNLQDLMHAADGVCVCHPIDHFPHIRFTFWNRRMVDLTGYTQEEINTRGWYQSVYPDPEVQIRAKARMGMMREGINLEAEEWEITRADGGKRTLRISTALLGPGSDKPSVLAIMQDVSDLRQSERLLRKEHQELKRELERRTTQLTDIDRTLKASDSRYRALFERATDAIFIENDSDEILDVNPKACELLGYTREELVNMTVPDIQAPECRGKKGRVLRGELEDHRGKPFEVLDLHKDGTRIPVEVTNNRLDEKGLFLSIVRDIRERKAAEEARQEAYQILEKSPLVAFLWRNAEDWPVEYVTSNVVRVFGYTADDFLSGRVLYSKVVHPDDLERVAGEVATFSQDANRSEFTHAPYRIVDRDGDIHWITDSTFIRRDPAGAITHYQGIVMDVTDRIRAEEGLRRSEDEKRTILDSLKELVIYMDTDMRIVWANKAACESVGVPREALVGRPCHSLWGNSADPCPGCVVVQALASGRNEQAEVQTPDGRIWFNQGHPVFDENGVVSGGIETCLEITERKLAEAALKESEARYRQIAATIKEQNAQLMTINRELKAEIEERQKAERRQSAILENIPDIAWLKDRDSRFIAVNEPFAQACGWAAGDLVGRNDLDIWPKELAERYRADDADVMRSGQRKRVDEPLADASGQQKMIETIKTPIFDEEGAVIGTTGIARDINARKQMEDALRRSEERYRNFVEHSIEGIWLLTFDEPISIHLDPEEQVRRIQQEGYLAECNDVMARFYGYASRADMIGMRLMDLYGDSPSEHNFQSTLELVNSGYRSNDRETIERRADGARLHFLNNAVGIIENDCLMAIWGTQRDITQERIATSALHAEKKRLMVTLRSIGDAVIATDCEGRITLMNPIAEALTGWQEAEAVGRPLLDVFNIVNERNREPCASPVDKVLAKGQIVGLANHTLLIARDGREYYIADSGAPILDAEGSIIGVILVFRDITERQAMQRELLKVEKLQSLGVLAGGIAHDFNNFLTGIVGNLSLAKLDLQTGNPIDRALDEMEKAALRAKELTQQLLTFSKGGEPVKHAADIAELVNEAARFALRGSNVGCDIALDDDLHLADVDEGQIAQVLHNLIINADQAMPDGGSIRLRGENVILPPDNPYSLTTGSYIRLTIEDQGLGIRADHLKKVFDPYFTTKQKGSGLGLAVAYSVITKHDGQLTVDSRLGEGTSFTIILPASDHPPKNAVEETYPLSAGSGFILVMDDEDLIRDLAQRMLTKMGYRVAVAPDGQAALDRYRQARIEGDPFDAVILDLTVPGAMGGKETLEHLKELEPEVRAIVSSGYANDPIMANYQDYGFCEAVKKPYLLEDLNQALKMALKV